MNSTKPVRCAIPIGVLGNARKSPDGIREGIENGCLGKSVQDSFGAPKSVANTSVSVQKYPTHWTRGCSEGPSDRTKRRRSTHKKTQDMWTKEKSGGHPVQNSHMEF